MPARRVILDTNVLLSGIFFGGVPGRLLEAWQGNQLALVLSPAILSEYQRAGGALASRYPEIEVALGPILALLAQSATIVESPGLPEAVSADQADDKFLACALAADVQVIVSGDKHLLHVSGWRGIEVITARECLTRFIDDPTGRDR